MHMSKQHDPPTTNSNKKGFYDNDVIEAVPDMGMFEYFCC